VVWYKLAEEISKVLSGLIKTLQTFYFITGYGGNKQKRLFKGRLFKNKMLFLKQNKSPIFYKQPCGT